jgi:addiction module HigA family antidote
LRDELAEIGITGTELSRQIKVPENRIPQIVAGKRSITADTALRLGKWFGTTPAFWLNLQKSYELRKAARDIGKEIDTIPTRSREPV